MEGVTSAEIARRLDMISNDMREDFGEIKRRLDGFVLREVYAADMRRVDTQLIDLQRRQDAEETSRKNQVRWVWGVIIVPLAIAAVSFAAAWTSTH